MMMFIDNNVDIDARNVLLSVKQAFFFQDKLCITLLSTCKLYRHVFGKIRAQIQTCNEDSVSSSRYEYFVNTKLLLAKFSDVG